MEKILRKVKCAERNPTEYNKYWTDLGQLTYNDFYKQWLDGYEKVNVEYWYEEINLADLLKEATCNMKELFSTSKLFAKERYEKAYNYMIDNEKYTLEGKATTLEDFKKSLRIAAGLEE